MFHCRIKPNKDKPGTFHAPSCDGNSAKALTNAASYDEVEYGPDGEATTVRRGWLHDIWGDAGKGSWVHGQAELWRQWQLVVRDGRAGEPSAEAVRTFGHKCRRLFRCVSSTRRQY